MKKKVIVGIAAAAVLAAVALIVVLAASGGDNKAAAMWLVRAEGTVAVTDGEGADVPVRSMLGMELRMSLFDGYSVGTQRASYGWINLDDTKLTKLDQDSAVEINRDGRALELVVERGSLFFNVTKPLEEDETLEIRSSNMVMAVRGTCGWVRAVDGDTFDVYIIEGKVRCTARADGAILPAVEQVTAGQTARLSVKNGQPTVTVGDFDGSDVPDFVLAEAGTDPDVSEKLAGLGISAGNGGNAGNSGDGGDGPEAPGGAGSDPLEGLPEGEFVSRISQGNVSCEIIRIPEATGVFTNVFFDLPIFEGPGAGIEVINGIFADMARDFVSRTGSLASEGKRPGSYSSNYSASAGFPASGMATVDMAFQEYDANATRPWFSSTHYVLDLMTGERLTLTDVMDGTESEIRQAIKDALAAADFGDYITSSGWERVDTVNLDEVDFTVSSDGRVMVFFYQTTLGFGTGAMTEYVYLPLGARYGGEGLSESPEPTDSNVIASGVGWSLSAEGVLTVTPEFEGLDELNWDDAPWGEYRTQVTGLVIGEGITAINNDAFSHYNAVEELTLPDSLVSIGSQAFSYCLKLGSLTLGDSVESIGVGAFYGCDALTSVVIPRSVKTVESQAFAMCDSLREITLLGPVEELVNTVQSCSQLTTVNLPEGVKSLEMTFFGCTALTGVTLPSTLTEVGSDAFTGSGIRSLTVPEGVLSLGTRAFWNCPELTELSLPSTLTHIGDSAFADTPALETINFAGTREQWEALVSGSVAISDAVTVNCNG